MKFEYKIVHVYTPNGFSEENLRSVESTMNQMGRAGWELVNTEMWAPPGSDAKHYIISFKRTI